MLVWWAMTFAWIRGMIYAVRARRGELAPIVVFTLILSFAYSTVHGNVGLAFRQRSQIMIFLFLFAALGYEVKRLRRARRPLKGLLAEDAKPKPAIAAVAIVPPRPYHPRRPALPRRPS